MTLFILSYPFFWPSDLYIQNWIRFLHYFSEAFKSSHCLWIKSHYSTKFFTCKVLSNYNRWSGTVSVSYKKSEHATVFSINWERKGNKKLRFSSLKGRACRIEKYAQIWLVYLLIIVFEYTFMVSNILLVKFSTKKVSQRWQSFTKKLFKPETDVEKIQIERTKWSRPQFLDPDWSYFS